MLSVNCFVNCATSTYNIKEYLNICEYVYVICELFFKLCYLTYNIKEYLDICEFVYVICELFCKLCYFNL